jgi:hypothetical protein
MRSAVPAVMVRAHLSHPSSLPAARPAWRTARSSQAMMHLRLPTAKRSADMAGGGPGHYFLPSPVSGTDTAPYLRPVVMPWPEDRERISNSSGTIVVR